MPQQYLNHCEKAFFCDYHHNPNLMNFHQKKHSFFDKFRSVCGCQAVAALVNFGAHCLSQTFYQNLCLIKKKLKLKVSLPEATIFFKHTLWMASELFVWQNIPATSQSSTKKNSIQVHKQAHSNETGTWRRAVHHLKKIIFNDHKPKAETKVRVASHQTSAVKRNEELSEQRS